MFLDEQEREPPIFLLWSERSWSFGLTSHIICSQTKYSGYFERAEGYDIVVSLIIHRELRVPVDFYEFSCHASSCGEQFFLAHSAWTLLSDMYLKDASIHPCHHIVEKILFFQF